MAGTGRQAPEPRLLSASRCHVTGRLWSHAMEGPAQDMPEQQKEAFIHKSHWFGRFLFFLKRVGIF